MRSVETQRWIDEFGHQHQHLIEDAIEIVGSVWSLATQTEKREYLQLIIDLMEKF